MPKQGQCNSCKEWNTIAEKKLSKKKGGLEENRLLRAKPKAFKINEIDSGGQWTHTDSELNRVLGGGIVPGSLILLGGGTRNRKKAATSKFH
jgi:DNA repair protein RadA/Sms